MKTKVCTDNYTIHTPNFHLLNTKLEHENECEKKGVNLTRHYTYIIM